MLLLMLTLAHQNFVNALTTGMTLTTQCPSRVVILSQVVPIHSPNSSNNPVVSRVPAPSSSTSPRLVSMGADTRGNRGWTRDWNEQRHWFGDGYCAPGWLSVFVSSCCNTTHRIYPRSTLRRRLTRCFVKFRTLAVRSCHSAVVTGLRHRTHTASRKWRTSGHYTRFIEVRGRDLCQHTVTLLHPTEPKRCPALFHDMRTRSKSDDPSRGALAQVHVQDRDIGVAREHVGQRIQDCARAVPVGSSGEGVQKGMFLPVLRRPRLILAYREGPRRLYRAYFCQCFCYCLRRHSHPQRPNERSASAHGHSSGSSSVSP